jgi:D-alanyl-D-alanine carboxypeptidase
VRLSSVDAFRIRLRKPPLAGLVFDVDTGEVLWRLHPYRRRPIASLTKIMTALLVTKLARPGERVRITRAALRYQGSGIGVLRRGKRVRLETLLNGLLLVSGNDAAIALAVHVAGSQRHFVQLMNRHARELGLRCTHYVDSHGLSRRNHSCPRDLAVLTRRAMRDWRIVRIARRPRASFPFPVKGGRLVLYGHNPLIEMHYRGTIGLKTGYTSESGPCFVGVVRRHGRTLAVVLLDSPNPGAQAKRLLDVALRRS